MYAMLHKHTVWYMNYDAVTLLICSDYMYMSKRSNTKCATFSENCEAIQACFHNDNHLLDMYTAF